MNKRFIAILLIVALLPSLIVPASASSFDDPVSDSGLIYTDYKTADYYDWEWSNYSGGQGSYYSYDGKVTFTSVNNVSVTFIPNNLTYPSDYLMFCIYARQSPAQDRVYVEFGDGVNVKATYEGGLYEEGRYNYYFFRVDMPEDCTHIKIIMNTNGTYTGDYGLYSCFGYTSVLDTYDKIEYYWYDVNYTTEGGVDKVLHKKVTGTNNAATLPVTFRNDTTTDLRGAEISFLLNSRRFKTTAVENVSFHFETYADEIGVTASLVTKDATPIAVSNIPYNIKCDSLFGLTTDFETGLGVEYTKYNYQVELDLSGIDLEKYDVLLYLTVDAVDYYADIYNSRTMMVEVTLRSITYVPQLVVSPWYEPIKNMFDRLRNAVNDGFDWMATAYYRSVDWLEAIWDNMNTQFELFTEMWNNRWDTLMSKLEDYFGEDGEMAEKADEMEQQANQMQQANDAMNSVEKPSVDSGAMLDQYLNFNPTGLAILSVITNNSFATSMLVVIFTFALCGYIFFGKKR